MLTIKEQNCAGSNTTNRRHSEDCLTFYDNQRRVQPDLEHVPNLLW